MFKPLLLLVAGFMLIRVAGATGKTSMKSSFNINRPFQFGASYIGDFYSNMTGGMKTGNGFLGMANLKMEFDTEKAGWWRGGDFSINGASTHGKSPSKNFTGDFQVVSNIDAGNLIYLYELWFKQTFSRLELTIGLQDMNQLFAITDNGSYFLNSSFGIPPVISNNVSAPIFPLTGIGLSAVYCFTNKASWLVGIFDGSPTDFENNPYNIYWDWDEDDGLFFITEAQYKASVISFGGLYKCGFYYHTGAYENDVVGLKSQIIDRNYGFYLIGDQTIWKGKGGKRIDLFAQLAWSPGNTNTHNFYVGGGGNYHRLFNCRNENILGIAIATAGFHRGFHKHETIIETFFNYQLNKFIFLQPDFQYIINPAGTNAKLKNALIGFLRFNIQF
jgi:porin